MLIDSGATKSLIDKTLFWKYFPEVQVTPPKRKTIAANKTEIIVDGETKLNLAVGKHEFLTDVSVAELGHLDGILGMNFLRTNGFKVDHGQGILEKDGWCVTLMDKSKMHLHSSRVKLSKNLILPARHEIITQAFVVNRNRLPLDNVIIEPVHSLIEEGLLLAKSVVDASNSQIPITLANFTDELVELEEGTTIALASPVQGMSQPLVSLVEDAGDKASEGEKEEDTGFYGVPEHLHCILEGCSSSLSNSELHEVAKLLIEYQNCFVGPDGRLGKTHLATHSIDTGDSRPIKQHPRRVPLSLQEEMDKEIDKMLEQGIISESESAWSSPVVLVKKASGGIRFCVDYRKLNSLTKVDAYPLPRIDETLDVLGGNRYFSSMDMASGFWQVPMDAESRDKSAFTTRRGLYSYNFMSFGLVNAPATFERVTDRLLRGIQYKRAICYIDDILTWGKTFKEMLENLREVLSRVLASGLKLKPSKCEFFKDELVYLGHKISMAGVTCDPGKVSAVKDWPVPTNLREVRSIVGMASYYRKFIPKFSEIAKPLTTLTKKNVQFRWSPECQLAFETLKQKLISSPILSFPKAEGQLILETDACNTSVAGVLTQVQDGEEVVLGYASRTLSKSQFSYCTTYKELLAVRLFVEHFKAYLYGREFTVRTDHASLTWLKNFEKAEGMILRWITFLETYSIKWVHRPGAKHQNADCLSRKPPSRTCKYRECIDCGEEEFKCKVCSPPILRNVNLEGRDGNDSKKEEVDLANQIGDCYSIAMLFTDVSPMSWDDSSVEGDEIVDSANELENDSEVSLSPESRGVGSEELTDSVEAAGVILQPIETVTMTPLVDFEVESSEREMLCSVPYDRLHDGESMIYVIDDSDPDDSSLPGPSHSETLSDEFSGWLVQWDRVELSNWQREDPDLNDIMNMLAESPTRPAKERIGDYTRMFKLYWAMWDELELSQGILYRRKPRNKGRSSRLVCVAPVKLRKMILEHVHNTKLAGHLAVTKTLYRVRQAFFWMGMAEDVSKWCKNCKQCSQKQGKNLKHAKMLHSYVGEPMQRISLDVIGPLPTTTHNQSYILVVIDNFSRWMECYAMEDQQAFTVADKFVTEFVCRYGVPMQILTDQGPDFMSKLFTEMCKLLEIEKLCCTPYQPRANGLVERANKTIQSMLKAFVNEIRDDWDDYLPYVQFAFLSTVQSSTGYSPSQLFLGRSPMGPLDLLLGRNPNPENNSKCYVAYVEWVKEAMTKSFEFA